MVNASQPWYRAKPPDQIARDALAMAAHKRRSGCEPCVDAYITLARDNGATDEEIAAVLEIDPRLGDANKRGAGPR
jgi:AhpD family alkylhydroperoxidase